MDNLEVINKELGELEVLKDDIRFIINEKTRLESIMDKSYFENFSLELNQIKNHLASKQNALITNDVFDKILANMEDMQLCSKLIISELEKNIDAYKEVLLKEENPNEEILDFLNDFYLVSNKIKEFFQKK